MSWVSCLGLLRSLVRHRLRASCIAASTLLKLLDALEDNDDVQRVAANFDIDDDVLERLSA